jgi:hypothetical protein
MTKRKSQWVGVSGRPPKEPKDKLSKSVRCLVSPPVASTLCAAAELHGIAMPTRGVVPSDVLRLYIVHGLQKDGIDVNIDDATFESLRQLGLV